MPAVQYPFIDIAVHERVRDRFSSGQALALFSMDLDQALWANGRGAALFGTPVIYDFLERGPSAQDVTFRQLSGAARRLQTIGDRQSFTIRVMAGFRSLTVPAVAEVIAIEPEQPAILFCAVLDQAPLSLKERAGRMIEGFDDADIHMAVLDDKGSVIAASSGFERLAIAPQTARTLISMAQNQSGKIVKRPVPTGRGYLPAATGQLAEDPALNLIFVVETALGTLDPSSDFADMRAAGSALSSATPEPSPALVATPGAKDAVREVATEAPATVDDLDTPATDTDDRTKGFDTVLDAIADIEDVSDVEAADAVQQANAEAPADAADRAHDDDIDEVLATEGHEDLFAVTLHDGEPASPAAKADAFTETEVDAEADSGIPVADQQLAVHPGAATTPPDAPSDTVSQALNAQAQTVDDAPFIFDPAGRALRFVWKIDAAGRFSSVSHEFAQAVGPKAAAVEGMSFSDLSALFNLDPDGKIAELLNRRDTWSGKTIFWPVEGTSLVVPIDLAALPTYTRTREFDGFRGFGIVRIADAEEDPHAVGMALSGSDRIAEDDDAASHAEVVEPFTLPAPEETASESDLAKDEIPLAEETDASAAPVAVDEPQSYAPPEHEVPVLKITETPGRRYSDKVVQFEEHRRHKSDGLSASERAAFQEIGRTLKPADDGEIAPVEKTRAVTPDPGVTNEDRTESDQAIEVPTTKADETVPGEKAEAGNEGAGTEAVTNAEVEAKADASPDAEVETTTDAKTSADNEVEVEVEADDFADYTRGDDAPASRAASMTGRPGGAAALPPLRFAATLTAETVDQMPVALLIHTGDRLIHANPEFLRLTGYADLGTLSDVGGLDALLQRDDLDAVSRQQLDGSNEAAAQAGGMVVVTAQNDLIPVRAKLQSVRWNDTSALMLSLVATEAAQPSTSSAAAVQPDETEAGADGNSLSEMKGEIEELHSILETATDGVVLLGEDGTIRSLNRSASALFNYDNDEIANKPFVTLFAHESQRAVLDYLSGLAHNGVASVLNDGREVIGREASGGFLPMFMTIGRLKSTNGYCAVIRDITQWKRTEEDLRNAKRVAETANAHKTDFLARVSHEIRTPLNAIIGFADMMAHESFGPVGHPRYIEYSNDIVRSGRHVLDIVNDLLDISKIEAGQMDVDFRAVALNDTIAEAVSIVQPQANNQRVIIRTALSQSVPPIVADLRSIKQIMLNILSNAIKFTPSGGQIVVSTAYEPNGSVTLRIRDTGIGMTRSELEQAMKPFRQVAASSSRVRGDGTGLGLPLTKAMVDANRANFSITSTPNEGTLVEISFPSQRVLAQ